MNAPSDIVAPQAVLDGDAAEDRRRDEVLCRLLNTPYRQICPQRANADQPAAPVNTATATANI